MARSRAKARLNFSAQGQRSGRCRVNRRAERVSRPAREKNRRRRVLVVAIRSPRPIRAVQRARLWAIVWTASQAPLAAKRPEGRWFSPTPYLTYGILDLGVAAMVSLQFEQLPVPVGDEAMIAVFGEEGELGTGRRLHPPDDEPYRRGVRLGLEGGAGGLGHIGGTVHPVRNRRPGIFGYRLDEIVQAFVLADGDGVADIHLAADGYHAMSVETGLRALRLGRDLRCRHAAGRRRGGSPRIRSGEVHRRWPQLRAQRSSCVCTLTSYDAHVCGSNAWPSCRSRHAHGAHLGNVGYTLYQVEVSEFWRGEEGVTSRQVV